MFNLELTDVQQEILADLIADVLDGHLPNIADEDRVELSALQMNVDTLRL